MIDIIMFILICIGLLLIINKKNSNIYNIALIVFILLSFTFAVSSSDSYAYKTAFSYISKGYDISSVSQLGFGLDYGYLYFMKLISFITNEYLVFRFTSSFISIFIILMALKKYNKKSTQNLLLYFLFPMAFDTFQIEFFLAYSIVTYALSIIINGESKNKLKFVFLVIFASFIHQSVIIFLPLVFIDFSSLKGFEDVVKKIFVPLILIFLLLNIFFRLNVVKLIITIFPFLKDFVRGYYIDKNLNILTIIMSCTLFILVFLYSFLVRKESIQNNKLFFMNCLSLFFLPMIFVSLDFERLLRPQLIINYAFIINSFGNKNDSKINVLRIMVILMLVFRFFVHLNYYISNNIDIINALFFTR